MGQLPAAERVFGLHNKAITAQFPLLSHIKDGVADEFCMAPEVEGGKVIWCN